MSSAKLIEAFFFRDRSSALFHWVRGRLRVEFPGTGTTLLQRIVFLVEPMKQAVFSSLDYSLLLIYLIVVVGIGVWVGRGQKNTEDYFLAGRSMGWFPIGISTIASLYSAIS